MIWAVDISDCGVFFFGLPGLFVFLFLFCFVLFISHSPAEVLSIHKDIAGNDECLVFETDIKIIFADSDFSVLV